jgi:hypothetical protein
LSIFGPQAPIFGSDVSFVDQRVDRSGLNFGVEIEQKNERRLG